jgi:hypothetical protein
LLGIPKDKNPANDSNGSNCAVGQNEPGVWFLCGTLIYDEPVIRNCTIPSDKEIFFPTICEEISYIEYPQFNRETQLREAATDAMNHVRTVELTVDNTPFERSLIPRIQTSLFDLTLTENNIFNAPKSSTKAVSDGYWVRLPRLTSNKVDLHFVSKAFFVGFVNGETTEYKQDVTYHLTVSK